MKNLLSIVALLLLLLAGLLWLPQPETPATATPAAADSSTATIAAGSSTLIRNVRVFDGEQSLEATDLLLRDGLVHSIGDDLELPPQATLVDGSGKTALPGLIDAHVHSYGTARTDALRFGVTSMLDMFRPPFDFANLHAEREALQATERADLFSAGFLATAAGGHGTQYGIEVPTVTGPEQADAWVAARKAEGSDWIKIIIEPGWGQRTLPTLDAATVKALVAAAHVNDMLAVAHVSTYADAQMAIETGIDGLVHLFADRRVDQTFIDAALKAGVFVVPTMPVLAGMYGHEDTDWLLQHPALGPRLSSAQRNSLATRFPIQQSDTAAWSNVEFNVAALHQAGIAILAGSDAPNPATTYGASLQHALRLLVHAGLSPLAALRAATSAPARAFALRGRGCLKPGCRADLLLVNGNPLVEIEATAMLDAVWKNGQQVELALPAEEADANSMPTAAADTPVDLLSNPARWMAAADDFMGGASSAAIEWGQGEHGQVLAVTGEVAAGYPFPYAGAMWFANDIPMQPVDHSQHTRLLLNIKGSPGDYQVLFFSGASQATPPVQVPVVSGESNLIDLDGIAGLDLTRLRAIGVFASGAARAVEFSVSAARLE